MRVYSLTILALLAACAPGESSDVLAQPTGQAPVAGTMTLQVGPLVTGQTGTFTISGVTPGARPWVVWGVSVRADGWCPPQTAPFCLDVRTPAGPVAQAGPANASGVSVLQVTVPASPLSSFGFQAIQFAPSINASQAAAAQVLTPGGDEDGDGLTNADEVGVHGTNPYQADSDGAGMEDGDEVRLGLDPTFAGDDPLVLSAASALAGDLILTEAMITPAASTPARGTWIEVHNPTADYLELGDATLRDAAGTLHNLPALIVGPGSHTVLGSHADPLTNGGYAPDVVVPGLNLSAGGAIELRGNTVIDTVTPTPLWPFGSGVALSLGAGSLDDDNAERAWWCEAGTAYGDGDLGTPGTANPPCAPSTLSYTSFFTTDVLSNCTGCHTGGGAQGGVNFSTYTDLFQSSVDVPTIQLVTPGDPDASYLYLKVADLQDTVPGGTGLQMPRGGTPLGDAVQADLRDWIVLGAPE